MASLYACDNRLRDELPRLKPAPGYCIFIDVVDSVALMDKGLSAWCDAMYNVVCPVHGWLYGVDSRKEVDEANAGSGLTEPHGLPPLKVIGDCLMFYVPKQAMARGADALTIFSSLLKILRVPKDVSEELRPEVRVSVTLCEDVYEVTFVPGTEDVQGKGISLAARLVKAAEPQELLMDEGFYREAKCVFLNWRAAGNVAGRQEPYELIEAVQGPWTTTFKGFREPVRVYKWRGPRGRSKS